MPPKERRFTCAEICLGNCEYVTVDQAKPKAVKRPCIRGDRKGLVLFQEV